MKGKGNKVLQKLKRGKCVSVVNVGSFPCSLMVEIIGQIGFDCLWLDMEHRGFGLLDLAEMTLACRATGMEPMVRIVKGLGYPSTLKPLEAGASGLMIPHCLDAAEARQYVSWSKFPPQGTRGFDNAGPDGDYCAMSPLEYIKRANEETFLVFQIEDKAALDRIDEIASVPGVDILFIGPADLTLSLGIPFDFANATFKFAVDRVARAAAAHKKAWGMPIGSVDAGKMLLDKGARFLTHGADIIAVRNGYLAFRAVFDQLGA